MGGSSSSNSSSSTSTTTNQEDNRVAVEAGGIGVGANANVTFTDLGVVAGATDFLNNALGAMGNVVDQVTERMALVVSENNAILKEQSESDVKEIGSMALKGMVGVGALIVLLVLILIFGPRKGKK